MRNILWTGLALAPWLAAISAPAAVNSFTNTVSILPGNPPAEVAFSLPKFDPAAGTLNGVSLAISGFGRLTIEYTNSPGAGATVFETNAISVLYNHSNIVYQKAFTLQNHNYPNPLPGSNGIDVSGQSLIQPSPFLFTLPSDLANFTGTGNAPLSAEYFGITTVTVVGGPVLWNVTPFGSVTAIVSYDYAAVPEPTSWSLLTAGVLTGSMVRHRKRIFCWA
jgi:hypothetical protein